MSANIDIISGLNWKGEICHGRGEYQKAITCFGKVLAQKPNDSFALQSMKKILYKIKPVYYDTSVWVSYLLGDKFSAKCKDLIKGEEFKTNTVIVPRLVIMETIQALRYKFTYSNVKKSKLGEQDIKNRRTEASNKIKEFSILLDDMIAEGRIVHDVELISPKMLVDRASDIFERYDGWTISWTAKCEKCGNTDTVNNKCEICNKCIEDVKVGNAYRGLGYADIQHACIAAAHYASEFFSMDVAFKHLAGHEMFPDIAFCIIRGGNDTLRIDKFGR